MVLGGSVARSRVRCSRVEPDAGVELVAVNDPMGDNETMAFLLKHDSVGRTLPNTIEASDRRLHRRRPRHPRLGVMDPGEIPWSDYDIDVVIESTGSSPAARTRRSTSAGVSGVS